MYIKEFNDEGRLLEKQISVFDATEQNMNSIKEYINGALKSESQYSPALSTVKVSIAS